MYNSYSTFYHFTFTRIVYLIDDFTDALQNKGPRLGQIISGKFNHPFREKSQRHQ